MSSSHERYVLVVDDDHAYLSMLKLCMRTCGFNKVYTATEGFGALEYLDYVQFDLIVSDWNMMPMDGLELLRKVRQRPATSKTPFILMTANLSDFVWREAIDCGATEFLIKPFSLSSLRCACHLCFRTTEFESTNIVPIRKRMNQKRFEHRIANSPLTDKGNASETCRLRNLEAQVDQPAKTPSSFGVLPSDDNRLKLWNFYNRFKRVFNPNIYLD